MKRIVFLLIFLMISASVLHAQGRDIRRANRHLNRGNLDRALEHAQAAMEYEEVLEDAEIWVIKAQLFMEIALTEEEEYKDLVDNPVDRADAAMQRAIELDKDRNEYMLEIQQAMLLMSELVFNEGVLAYEDEDWGSASGYFLRAYEITEQFESQDTTILYNAAISAELAQDFDKARDLYTRLYEMEYDEPYLYTSLTNIAMMQGDTVAAREFVQEGRDIYPDNLDLIFAEANIHIFTGDTEEAERVLNLAIDRDPDNPALHFAFAANYDAMAQDTLRYDREEREFAYHAAIESYERALELEPEYFDAKYNLGALFFNRGLQMLEEAEEELRETQDFAAYQEREEKIKEVWLEAQPHLEGAFALIDEDDRYFTTVLISLVELYMRTGQTEEFEEIRPLYEKYYGEPEGEMIE